ncbi:MAG: VWA domain-containing protein [Vicinamibacterales bacterium]|jgi:Ca-activated chloride channel family protein|nr:VWA domain-containing protein [Vicinamibacterales bacterium]
MPPVEFVEPIYLWLLVLPVGLGLLAAWQLSRRRRDARRALHERTTPIREQYAFAGGLSFWFCLVLAVAALVLALSRPQVLAAVSQNAGADFIILQDGSTSMRVSDVTPDRWQRSVAWVRMFAELLSWQDERVALALFAHRAAPQIRLTRDPNALFFFLDYLDEEPPFRLEDDTSWDTNIEEGIYWGVQMFDLDEELYGERLSSKAFIVISDGQAWSGEVDAALQLAAERGIRVYVIGVGTSAGGFIPQLPPGPYDRPEDPIHSVLDRRSLRTIAQAGGGEYFELGIDADEDVALQILTDVQRRAQATQREETFTELYWYLLVAAAGLVCIGTLLLKERTQLWWQLATAGALVAVLMT